MDWIIYFCTGIGAGILSGLFGLGGGIIIVPSLLFIFTQKEFASSHLMQFATSTSLAAMLFTTGMATWSHSRRHNVQWSLLKFMVPALLVGALGGAWLVRMLSTQTLRYAFVVFIGILGIQIILGAKKEEILLPHSRAHAKPILLLFGLGVGVITSLLGIGGGVLMIPFFMWFGLPMVKASATSIACVFPTILTGALASAFIAKDIQGLPPQTWGYVYWPAALMIGVASLLGTPLGVYLAMRLPVPLLKRLFGGLLLIAAWRMIE